MDKQDLQDYIMLWNHAIVKVLDVRHFMIDKGEKLPTYRLPTNAFLFAVNGRANIMLDGDEHIVERLYVLHGGKGMQLEILAGASLEYYLIFYKARLPLYGSKHVIKLIKSDHLFQQPYGFHPNSSLTLLDLVRMMDKEWNQVDTLKRLHVKVLFYRFAHELLRQISDQGIETIKSDLVSRIIQYMHERYKESITLESVADAMSYNIQHLSRQFKRQTGQSPIAYLLEVRINKAKELLLLENVTVQEVAEHVGYNDPLYFSRLFKKHTGVTPGNFKKEAIEKKEVPICPYSEFRLSIVEQNLLIHNNDIDNHNHYMDKGDLKMYKKTKMPMASVLLLCISLLLSACTGTVPGSSSAPGGSQAQTNAVADSQQQTKIISTVQGDVEIPVNPKRIIVTNSIYAGYPLVLGVKPIGLSNHALNNEFFAGLVDGVVNIGDDESAEKILSLNPDLIITTSDSKNLDNLKKITATIGLEYGVKNFKEQLREFGVILGKEEEAEKWIRDWDNKIAEYKPRIQEKMGEKTVSILGVSDKMVYAYGANFGRGGEILYGEFGLKAPEKVQKEAIEGTTGWASLSLEALPEYAGDYIFVEESGLEVEVDHPVWKTLPAVLSNHVYPVDPAKFSFVDPLSLDKQLEFVVKSLLGDQE